MRMAKMMKYHCGKTSGVDVLSQSLRHLVILFGDLGTGICLAYWPQHVYLSFSTYLSRGLYHGEVISVLFCGVPAFVAAIYDKRCIRPACDEDGFEDYTNAARTLSSRHLGEGV
jgi:hypothetical protein